MADAPMWKGTKTSSTGDYQVAVSEVPAIEMRLSKDGYVLQTSMFHVGEDMTMNFALTPAPSRR